MTSYLHWTQVNSLILVSSRQASNFGICECLGNSQEKYTNVLYNSVAKEPTKSSRCFVINLLGLLLYSELSNPLPSPSVKEGLNILLACIQVQYSFLPCLSLAQFPDSSVALTAIDSLTLMTECINGLMTHYSSYIDTILQCLSAALSQLLRDKKIKVVLVVSVPCHVRMQVMVSVLLCIRDWIMSLPVKDLITCGTVSMATLHTLFQVLPQLLPIIMQLLLGTAWHC